MLPRSALNIVCALRAAEGSAAHGTPLQDRWPRSRPNGVDDRVVGLQGGRHGRVAPAAWHAWLQRTGLCAAFGGQ